MDAHVRTRLLRNSDFSNPIEMSQHPDLTIEVLRLKRDMIPICQHHPNFTFQWVIEFPDRFWDWNDLSERVPFHFFLKHLDLPWNWRILTRKTPTADILANPNLSWDFATIIIPKVTVEHLTFLRIFRHKIPQYTWVTLAAHTSWPVFFQAQDLPWVFYADFVPLTEFTEEHVPFLYMYGYLFDWVKLTISHDIRVIHAHPTLNWQQDVLDWNKSTWKTRVEPIETCIREWVAANTIKRRWKIAISCPEYRLCQKRLAQEYKENNIL
jgi:hypothetical protein